MRLLPFSPVLGLLCLAALASTACAPLAPSLGRPSPEVLQTLSSSALPDVSDYFADGMEWWGVFLFSIYTAETRRLAIIMASTTD